MASLIEKSITTPEYYPLSLNALVNACNQKSNRDPVVNFTEDIVLRALYGLRDKKLIWECTTSGSRVAKYQHRFQEVFELSNAELAILTVLMLRGAQTPGEIKARAGRLHEFSALGEVTSTLEVLQTKAEPLVVQLPLRPGHKEVRFAHVLTGEVPSDVTYDHPGKPVNPGQPIYDETERIDKLEAIVDQLQHDLDELKERVTTFIKQFD